MEWGLWMKEFGKYLQGFSDYAVCMAGCHTIVSISE